MSPTSTTSLSHCLSVWFIINCTTHQICVSKPPGFTVLYQNSLHAYHGLHDAVTRGKLSPHILPIVDLKEMLSHIEETLPTTMHLPVSCKDILHFYRYLCTHVLIANRQFLLLIDVPIQDHTQQLSIYKIFTLDIPHGNFTAWYDVSTQYLGVTQDETMAVEISWHQFSIYQEANGQFCNIYAPL